MGLAENQVLTFLFTDIESSASLWEQYPEEMAKALAEHDDLAQHHIELAGGELFKHTGDGIHAAFASPSAALDAAIGLLHSFQSTRLGGLPVPLAVRMGLHTGEASSRNGDYFGRTLNRVARIMAAANGNQIVVSQVTVSLSTDRQFEDHGFHELRGIGTERLYTVVNEKLESDTRPLRVVQASNLPVMNNAFVGRSTEVDLVVDRVRSARGVTLLGPGGVGKTRLAIFAAERLSADYADGTWLCRLDKAADPDSAVSVVAATVGAPPGLGRSLVDSIGRHLRGQAALVVLDNCEHVASQARDLVDSILENTEECAILATSRQPLGWSGEIIVPLTPLDPPTEGLELLVGRARERQPDFRLPASELAAAKRLCADLDGLPLAIELAAARLTVLSPTAILERLTDRFKLLRSRTGGGRLASLIGTIRWSYDLLDEQTRDAFRRLSVFRGGFTLTAAAAICGPEADEYETLDLLQSLVEKSMVNHGRELGDDRFTMLESLAHFGQERLASSGQEGSVRDTHLRWFTDLAGLESARLRSPDEPAAWETLDLEWDNLRVAFQRATASDDLTAAAEIVTSVHYYCVIALRFEGLAWSTQWLQHPGAADHPRRQHVLAASASDAYYRMDLEESRELAFEVLDQADDTEAWPFVGIWTFLALGDGDGAGRFVEGWQDKAARLPTSPFVASNIAAAGVVLKGTMRRDRQGVDHYLEQCQANAEASGAPSALTYTDLVEGMALARLDPDAALMALGRAEAGARKLSDRHAHIDGAQTAVAQIMASGAGLGASVRHTRRALETAAQHNFLPRIAHDLQSAAITLSQLGEAATAAVLIGASRAHGQQSWRRSVGAVAEAAGADAKLLMLAGEQLSLHEAAELAQEALSRADDSLGTT